MTFSGLNYFCSDLCGFDWQGSGSGEYGSGGVSSGRAATPARGGGWCGTDGGQISAFPKVRLSNSISNPSPYIVPPWVLYFTLPPAVLHRYFTLFMNLLNDCSEVEDEGQQVVGRKRGMSRRLASLRHCTVLAMSNLLNANVDSGLMHSIGGTIEPQTSQLTV